MDISNNDACSNNTNKLSPQEQNRDHKGHADGSNNTNKLSPQERITFKDILAKVQIIQINLVLKNIVVIKSAFLKFK